MICGLATQEEKSGEASHSMLPKRFVYKSVGRALIDFLGYVGQGFPNLRFHFDSVLAFDLNGESVEAAQDDGSRVVCKADYCSAWDWHRIAQVRLRMTPPPNSPRTALRCIIPAHSASGLARMVVAAGSDARCAAVRSTVGTVTASRQRV